MGTDQPYVFDLRSGFDGENRGTDQIHQIKGTDQELYPRFDHKTGVQINPKNKSTDQEKPGKQGVQFNNELINPPTFDKGAAPYH